MSNRVLHYTTVVMFGSFSRPFMIVILDPTSLVSGIPLLHFELSHPESHAVLAQTSYYRDSIYYM